ncbi:hypothetical protein ACMFMF_002931 [Clarireedia jacksonii]
MMCLKHYYKNKQQIERTPDFQGSLPYGVETNYISKTAREDVLRALADIPGLGVDDRQTLTSMGESMQTSRRTLLRGKSSITWREAWDSLIAANGQAQLELALVVAKAKHEKGAYKADQPAMPQIKIPSPYHGHYVGITIVR